MIKKLVFISDTHGYHDEVNVPYGDILIHCGDATADPGQADLRRFLRWFGSRPHPHKIFIAGNHDRAFEMWPEQAQVMVKEVCGPRVVYLQDSGCKLFGINFWGTPVTPRFFDWAFNRDPGPDIAKHFDLIPDSTDVLITHGPPLGFLDLSNNWNEATWEKFKDHLGSRDLRDAMYRVMPEVHAFGHIHGSGGKQETYFSDCGHKTTLVNASIVDEAYIPNKKPFIYEYPVAAKEV